MLTAGSLLRLLRQPETYEAVRLFRPLRDAALAGLQAADHQLRSAQKQGGCPACAQRRILNRVAVPIFEQFEKSVGNLNPADEADRQKIIELVNHLRCDTLYLRFAKRALVIQRPPGPVRETADA